MPIIPYAHEYMVWFSEVESLSYIPDFTAYW